MKIVILLALCGFLWADDISVLHRLAEHVAHDQARLDKSVARFNEKARQWEASCKAEGKTPIQDGFANPKCIFIPQPVNPPGTNKP